MFAPCLAPTPTLALKNLPVFTTLAEYKKNPNIREKMYKTPSSRLHFAIMMPFSTGISISDFPGIQNW